jgi:hypothetical protein
MTLAVRVSYETVGLRLWFYQALVILQFAAVLSLFVWLCRPASRQRIVASCIALACVCGLHTTRILFSFWPLNHHSAAAVLLLSAIALALQPRSRAIEWAFFPLTLTTLLLLESGLMIAPVIVVLWWVRSPGLGWRAVAGMVAGLALYAATRLALSGVDSPPAIYAESGLGFSHLSREDLEITFEDAPWLFWVYNVIASLLTVVASEPRAGAYRFVASLLHAETPVWSWVHVGSSLATTVAIIAGLRLARPLSGRDRLLVAGGATLIVCGSALGFLYTRDRIGLTSGLGYSLLLYVALAALLERPAAVGWKRVLVKVVIAAIAAGWMIRSVETYFQLRDAAWGSQGEWTVGREDLAGQPQTDLLMALRSAALRATPDDPRTDPVWSYTLLERRFTPQGESRPLPDAAADSATRPFSSPFNIRWKPDVDEAARLRLEARFGLLDAEQVARDPSGRTWTYRLREASRDRIRAIVWAPEVEDTARIDTERFQIER